MPNADGETVLDARDETLFLRGSGARRGVGRRANRSRGARRGREDRGSPVTLASLAWLEGCWRGTVGQRSFASSGCRCAAR